MSFVQARGNFKFGPKTRKTSFCCVAEQFVWTLPVHIRCTFLCPALLGCVNGPFVIEHSPHPPRIDSPKTRDTTKNFGIRRTFPSWNLNGEFLAFDCNSRHNFSWRQSREREFCVLNCCNFESRSRSHSVSVFISVLQIFCLLDIVQCVVSFQLLPHSWPLTDLPAPGFNKNSGKPPHTFTGDHHNTFSVQYPLSPASFCVIPAYLGPHYILSWAERTHL